MTHAYDTALEYTHPYTPDSLHKPLQALAQNGYAMLPNFLSPVATAALLAECQDLYAQGQAHTAGIGQGSRVGVVAQAMEAATHGGVGSPNDSRRGGGGR